MTFRNQLATTIFNTKYRHDGCETWEDLAKTLTQDVCGLYCTKDQIDAIIQMIASMKFIPGGRYLYYAGRPTKYFNNCYLLRSEEDSREDWAELSKKSELCLTSGGGIGNDYSIYRPRGAHIHKTGGTASGPIDKMKMIDRIGKYVIQGGSRRSAIYASLNWKHKDINEFLYVKDWQKSVIPGTGGITQYEAKLSDPSFYATLEGTNVSVNYDTDWYLNFLRTGHTGETFRRNVEQALKCGEPGFSFNFFDKERETLRNACTEVTSGDDSDVCNLGSINLSRITSISELASVVELSTLFLLCGTLIAQLPYDKIYQVREKNRRLGLGLMGVHEWLIQRGEKYNVTPELHQWLEVYKGVSEHASKYYSQKLCISTPVANRAIAPTGTIGILAGTTTGIEPVYAVAYKRRYFIGPDRARYQYNIDHAAQTIINETGVDPETIESSVDLAKDYERRIKFQADIQDYVDMGISSTINLPSASSNTIDVTAFAEILARYSGRIRGFTCYPDGARGGQPLVSVPYKEAIDKLGQEFEEHLETNDVCLITGKGGVCGT
jgi:ribonucleoside-diphosphate reductase alpha chain